MAPDLVSPLTDLRQVQLTAMPAVSLAAALNRVLPAAPVVPVAAFGSAI